MELLRKNYNDISRKKLTAFEKLNEREIDKQCAHVYFKFNYNNYED